MTVATNAALALVGLFSGVLAARLLGPAGRGELAAIQLWPALLGTIGGLGLGEALAFLVAKHPERGRALLATALGLAVPCCLVTTAFGFTAMPYLLRAQHRGVVDTARACLPSILLAMLAAAPHQALRGQGRFKAWNMLRLLIPAGWLLTLLYAAISRWADVYALALAFVGWTGLCAVAAQAVAWSSLKGPIRPARELVRPLIGFGVPTMFSSMPQWLNLRLDQLLMASLLESSEVGLYAVAVAWSGAVQPLTSAIAHVVVPDLAASVDPRARARRMYATGVTVSASATTLLIVATPFAVPWVFGEAFRPAVPAALVLVIAAGVAGVNAIGAECLRGLGRPNAPLAAECVGLVITAATLPWLLSGSGLSGAALASLLSYSGVLICHRRMLLTPELTTFVQHPKAAV